MTLLDIKTMPPVQYKDPYRPRVWILDQEWTILLETDEGDIYIRIHPSYWYDLASVPEFLHSFANNGSADYAVLIAALFHDAMYDTHYLSRALADDLFRQIIVMLTLRYEEEVTWKTRLAAKAKGQKYYWPVRIAGGFPYDDYDPKQMEEDRRLISFNWSA